MLLMLRVVAVSFGVGLSGSGLLSGSLRVGVGGLGVEILAVRLVGTSLCGGFTAGTRAAFGFCAFFVDVLHGDFTGVFGGLHGFAGQGNKRFLVFMLPGGERIGFVHLVNGL